MNGEKVQERRIVFVFVSGEREEELCEIFVKEET